MIKLTFLAVILSFSSPIFAEAVANEAFSEKLASSEVFVNPNQAPFPRDGGLKDHEVALTFDDGPDPVTTGRILKILKKYGVRATFFEVGANAERHPEVTREIIKEGHTIGSHTWDHPDLAKLPLNEAIENVRRGHAAVEKAAGMRFHIPFFRFPHFSSTPELMSSIQNLGLISFHANIVTEDWMTPDPKELLKKSLSAVEAEKHGIIIFHDIQPQTADMLETFLSELKSRGYKTVVFRPKNSLASLAAARGIRFGTELFDTNGATPQFMTALHEFDLIKLPTYFRLIEPKENQFDFSLSDKLIDSAPSGTVFELQGLIHNEMIPDWLKNKNYNGEQLRPVLVNFVNTVMDHFNTKYPGKVIAWDIVNEALSWQGYGGFWHKIGLDAGLDQFEYVRLALQTARAKDPNAKLYINDFLAEGMDAKSDRMFQLVSSFKAQGVPIDGVGLQSHFMVESGGAFPQMPPEVQIVQNMNRLASLGLETMITEADFAIKNSEVSPTTLSQQATYYKNLLHACLSAKNCKAFSTWGIGDKDSWIMEFFPGWGTPLLFDVNYKPKPAYQEIQKELLSY